MISFDFYNLLVNYYFYFYLHINSFIVNNIYTTFEHNKSTTIMTFPDSLSKIIHNIYKYLKKTF